MDLFLSYKSPPLATIYVNSLRDFFELRITISLDFPPVCEVVSSFDEFIVLQLPRNVNMFFELFYFIFKLSKYYATIYIIYTILSITRTFVWEHLFILNLDTTSHYSF